MTTKIYGISWPGCDEVRYIGKTTSRLASRLQGHLYRARSGKDKSEKSDWLLEILAAGAMPSVKTICLVSDTNNWADAERREIKRFRNLGHRLFNKSPGGNGSHEIINKVILTQEVIERFGVDADSVIAEEIGVTRKAITYHREKLGICASGNRERNTPPPMMGGHNKIKFPQSIISKLGTMSDARLAKIAGCGKPAIRRLRISLGVPAYAHTTGDTGRFNGKGRHPRWGTQIVGSKPPV